MSGRETGTLKRVYFLVSSSEAPGGIARATATLASHLAQSHSVEIISLRRHDTGLRYAIDPRVKQSCVLDDALPSELHLAELPSAVPGVPQGQGNSALVDQVLPRVLGALEPGVVISTRPALHRAIALHAPDHCVKIAHEHNNLQFREVRDAAGLIAEAIGGLDKYVVLTEADADNYRRKFPEVAERLQVMRNPAPWPVAAPVRERQRVVVAAGHLKKRKGFDRLIDAYAPIAMERPNWKLHIYGEGPERRALSRQISRARLRDGIVMMGRTDEMEKVLEEAAIVALSSRFEGLPMILIEAMTKGAPIVAVDCPTGPSEIVVDGVTGRLVPRNKIAALTKALLELMDDPAQRARMSEQALVHAEQYQIDRIVQSWRDMFDDLYAKRSLVSTTVDS